MVKQRDDINAKILYKKSYTTYSRTCSTISNQYKSNAKQAKKKHSKGFYVEGGKIKRDVRIETDFCKQRRRLIKQLLKMSSADAKSYLTAKTNKSAKSRYSNISLNRPIEVFRDDSASGDNEKTSEVFNFTNKEEIMYNQLNLLVKTWVEQFLENKELKNMVQTVFETIMEKEQTKSIERSSSYTTYVLEQNDNTTFTKITSNYRCGVKRVRSSDVQSSYGLPTSDTVPIIYKTVRLVSTLSLPRNMHKKEIGVLKKKGQKIKVKKGHCKKTLMALIKPSEIEGSQSNLDFDLFEVSTNSWLKRCTNFNERNLLKKLKMGTPITEHKSPDKEAGFKGKQRDKDIMGSRKETNKLRHTRSLVVNIFEKNINMDKKLNNDNTMATFDLFDKNFTSNDSLPERIAYYKKNFKTHMLNETDESDTLVTIDLLANSVECESTNALKCTKQGNKTTRKKDTATLCANSSKVEQSIVKKPKKTTPKFEDIQHKKFSYLRKNLSRQEIEEQEFLSHLQDVFKYFSNYETKRDIKLDIHVNVYPTLEDSPKQSQTYRNESDSPQGFITNPTIMYNVAQNLDVNKQKHDTSNKPNIIPLLDGAVSQAKYLLNEESSIIKDDETAANKNCEERTSMANELGIKEELSEIKTVLMRVSNLIHECVIDNLRETVALQRLNPPKSELYKRTRQKENIQKCHSVTQEKVASRHSIQSYKSFIVQPPHPKYGAGNKEIIKYANKTYTQAHQNYKTDRHMPTQPDNKYRQVTSKTCHTCKGTTQQYAPQRSDIKCPNCQSTFSHNFPRSIPSHKTCNAYSQSPPNPILKCPNCRVTFSQDCPSIRKCSDCNSAASRSPMNSKTKSIAKASVAMCTSKSSLSKSVTCKTSNVYQNPHRETVIKYDKHSRCLQSSQSSAAPVLHQPGPMSNKLLSSISPLLVSKTPANNTPISFNITPTAAINTSSHRARSGKIPTSIIIPFPDTRSVPYNGSPKQSNRSTLTKSQSLGIQISNRFKSVNRSGFKLTKTGKGGKEKEKKKSKSKKKKKNVLKNLASYRIIESESIIEVTDMTLSKGTFGSAAATNIALTCSLPQAKSLYEISREETKKKITYISSSQDAGPSKGFCNTLPRDSTKSSCQYTVTTEAVNIKPCIPEVIQMESSEMELGMIENIKNLKPNMGSSITQESFNAEYVENKHENVKKDLKIESTDWMDKSMNKEMKLLKYMQSDVVISMPRKKLKMVGKKKIRAQLYPDLKMKIALGRQYIWYISVSAVILLMIILLNYFYIGSTTDVTDKKLRKDRPTSPKFTVNLAELGF